MRVLSYEDWLDKYGSDYAIMLYDWFNSMPDSVCLSDLMVEDIEDFINERVMYKYESYVSEFEDMEYERFKDEKCF